MLQFIFYKDHADMHPEECGRGDEAGHRGNCTGQDEPDSCLEQADTEGLRGEE